MARVEERPLVSVFTAAHEIGEEIGTAYRSLLAQSHDRWEWVVLDDSSSTATADYVAGLCEAPAAAGRIRLYRQQRPGGSIGLAKRVAAAACRGDVLVELDHDDELLPAALEIVAATFVAHPDVDFVFSDWIDWLDIPGGGAPGSFPPGWGLGFGAYASEVVGGRRVAVSLAPPLTWETIRHIVAAPNHVRAWRTRSYWRIGGHDPELAVADDFDLVVRTFLEGTTARIPRPLYVQHHDPAQGNASRRRNDEIQRLVAQIAGRNAPAIDRRCVSLGLRPSGPAALTSHDPIPAASATIDVVAEAAAARGEPLVSVVVPTFRRPELLERALESALAQTHENLEVLVVGDACPCLDDVVSRFADPRVRHANLHEHHGHPSAARNHALKTMARGTLVAYLDDDNLWRADHLESLVGLVGHESGCVYAFASLRMRGRTITCRRPRRFQIDTSALLHQRFLLERHGFWRPREEVDFAEDWELVSRWAGEPWAASLQPTVDYALDPSPRGDAILRIVERVAEEERVAARTP